MDVLGWLLERLQQGVPGGLGQHVGLVEDEHPFEVADDATVVTLTLMSRMSSTELWDAASSPGRRAKCFGDRQLGHVLHGAPSDPVHAVECLGQDPPWWSCLCPEAR